MLKPLTLFFLVQCLFVNGALAAGKFRLKVTFKPDSPFMPLTRPTQVKGVAVFDYSRFSTQLTNRNFYSITIKNVIFTIKEMFKQVG